MAITREFLENHIVNLQRQIAAYNGAVEFAQMLVAKLADDEAGMPVQDFAEMVAGTGATVEFQESEE